jgi:hypothetical protein
MSIRRLASPARQVAAVRRAAPFLLMLSTLAVPACDENFADPTLIDDSRSQLVVVSGDGQSGAMGAPLAQPLRVQVRDEHGNPAARQRVEFRTLIGEGLLSSVFGITDFAGFTEVRFVPLTAGELVVEAEQPGGGRVVFESLLAIDSSQVRNPASFQIVGGNNQTGAVGTILPLPLTIRVANAENNPIVDYPVLFTAVTDGTLLLTANEGDFTQIDSLGNAPAPSDSIGRQIVSFTDENGVAGALLRLHTRPGVNQVTATSTAATATPSPVVHSITFTATGTAGSTSSADSIAKISGDEQNVTFDTTGVGFTPEHTFNPMVVQVTDRFGNPIPGITVFFRVSNGFGTLSNTTDVTDENGFAETTYTSNAGNLGGIAIAASVPGIGTVTFTGLIEAVGGTPEEEGGDGGGEEENPNPVLTSISPDSAAAGGPGFLLTLNGRDFLPESEVRWGGAARPTAFISPTQLQATISGEDIATPGPVFVTVFNPEPGGGSSAARTFTVTP